MKKLFPLAVGLLCALNMGAMADDVPTKPNAALSSVFTRLKGGEKITVVAFGTSLTQYGAWVKMMEDWFNAQYPGQVTVINSGGSGQTSVWGKDNVREKVVAPAPDLVLVEFAYNDAHQRFQISPDTSAANLDEIVTVIHEAKPATAIVVQTMNAPWDPPAGQGMADSETNRPDLALYCEAWVNYAKAHDLALADHYPKWLALKEKDIEHYQKIVPDGSHPNKIGAEEVTWPGLEALFTAAAK